MANVFKNSIKGPINTTGTVVYTTPASTATTVIGINVANIVDENIYVDVQLTDNSESITKYLVKNSLIPEGSSAVLVGGEQKIVLESGDSITIVSSIDNAADTVVSVLEIS